MVRIIISLLLLMSVKVSAQQEMFHAHNYIKPSVSVNPLLDDYPSAQWAVSFRLLRTAYSGNCVRVRRLSDNTEQDIGFSSGFCDTASLKTFIGSSKAKVVTWYDQSGNSKPFATVDTAHQPYIAFSSGKLIYNKNGAMSMSSREEGATNVSAVVLYLRNTFTGATTASTFVVLNTVTGGALPFGNPSPPGGQIVYSLEVNSSYFMLAGSGSGSAAYAGLGTPTSYVNGVSQTITTRAQAYTYTTQPQNIGVILYTGLNLSMSTWTNVSMAREGAATSFPPPTYYTEYIMYASDKSTDRLGIEANINSYYTIY